MMRPLHIPSGDDDDNAEDDEAGASPLAGNCGGADVEIFRSIRGSAHLSFSSFSFSSAFSYISNFSQSPNVPILLLNAITFRVGHRLPHVVRQTFRFQSMWYWPLKIFTWTRWHLGTSKKVPWSAIPGTQPQLFNLRGQWPLDSICLTIKI